MFEFQLFSMKSCCFFYILRTTHHLSEAQNCKWVDFTTEFVILGSDLTIEILNHPDCL